MKINNLLESILPEKLVNQYESLANSEREGGGKIKINYGLPTIRIQMSDGTDYFFQEHEATDLLDQVPDNISPEDFILAQAQNW